MYDGKSKSLLGRLPFLIDASTNPVKPKLQRIHSCKMKDDVDDALLRWMIALSKRKLKK